MSRKHGLARWVAATAGLLSLAATEAAAFEWTPSYGFSLVSDYRFRGVSQSDNGPAGQGSITLTNGGWSASIWASSVEDFADAEIDFTGSYSFNYGDNSFSVGGIYYGYSGGADNLDYLEAYGTWGRSFGKWGLGYGFYYSPEFFGESGTAAYVNPSVSYAFSDQWSLNAGAGYQWIEENAVFALPDYANWNLYLSYSPSSTISLSLGYEDTNISEAECGGEFCDPTVVMSVGFSF